MRRSTSTSSTARSIVPAPPSWRSSTTATTATGCSAGRAAPGTPLAPVRVEQGWNLSLLSYEDVGATTMNNDDSGSRTPSGRDRRRAPRIEVLSQFHGHAVTLGVPVTL